MNNNKNDSNRKRASSLRTQLFNKHLFDKINPKWKDKDKPEDIELNDVDSNNNNNNSKNNDNISSTSNHMQDNDSQMCEAMEESLEDKNIIKDSMGDNEHKEVQSTKINFFTKSLDLLLDRRRILHSKDGRHIPITLDHTLAEYRQYTNGKSDVLIDERTNKPYCNNCITSSRYTIYSFLPKQLYAQFSKVANIYFFVIAILQMIPGWSTTGTYTTIIPLLVFMSISMAREVWNDFRRHQLDNEENARTVNILIRDPTLSKELESQQNQQHNDIEDNHDKMYSKNSYGLKRNDDKYSAKPHFLNVNLLASKYNIHIIETKWKDLKVGDFVVLKQDDWVPADLLLLKSDGTNNEVYVETMALDGETNLKNRQPHMELSKLTCSESNLSNINAKVIIEDPNSDLYNFEGNLEVDTTKYNAFKKYPIGPDNVIYRGSIIRNTPTMIGMVIFTGEETKIRMNAIKNPRTKAPKLQRSINMIIAFMVFVVACVSFFSYLGNVLAKRGSLDDNRAWYLFRQDAGTAATIMSFIIMFNTMIPLSLYVTMEIIKVFQGKLMEWDIDMYHEETDTPCESRTATILEELGQVSYIFSDKTGTLTDNKMIFRKFSFLGSSWLHDMKMVSSKSVESLQTNLTDNDIDTVSLNAPQILSQHLNIPTPSDYAPFSDEPRPSIDYKGNSSAVYTGRPSMSSLYIKQHKNRSSEVTISSQGSSTIENIKSSYDLIRYIQRYPNKLFSKKAKFFILSMALCHSCLPKRVDGHEDEEDAIEYQSSSPDELALITAARDLGCVVVNKNVQTLTIKTYPNGFDESPILEEYEILNTIEFNSQRKRMSVIIKMPNVPNNVLLICKGADNVILERLYNKEIAFQKIDEINNAITTRKEEEAELIVQQRKSLERMTYDETIGRNSLRGAGPNDTRASLSLQAIRKSISQRNRTGPSDMHIDTIDDIVDDVKRNGKEVDDVIMRSRKSLHKQQMQKYGSNTTNKNKNDKISHLQGDNNHSKIRFEDEDIQTYIGNDDLLTSEEFILERTIQAIDDFSTEGLRTLLFAYKWIDNKTYDKWNQKYHKAKTSLVNRKKKTEEVGEEIEVDLNILGATAIEDKLQEGVSEAIEKIKRAGIKMWMLTGDKRETAINIGYSCKLIYDYSTIVILTMDDENIASKMNAVSQEISTGNMAHCVVVIDGATLGSFESNPTLMAVFVELCTKTDSVICCRASPSQKALMVSNIRKTNRKEVTLAIGDGANDIAMIQAADIGVGITGKEGLQASRSSDYSIAQFRYLLKLLFVHGRYNYIRTAKFVLCTFYKELTFYLTQVIFQRFTLFSGTSMYESWSLSMFNTLFTSLPVLCIGIFEKDLKPMTLLTIPELYSFGRLGEGFNLWIFLEWMIEGACNSVIITFLNVVTWGETALSDSTLYPLGVVNFTAIVVLINVKAQFLEMRNRNWIAFASVLLSTGGWLVWCCALPILNPTDEIYDVAYGFYYHFGKDITFWCTCFALVVLPVIIDIVYQTLKRTLWPTDSDIFAELEKKSNVRKKLEFGAYNEMKQGWTWEHDPSSIERYKSQLFNNKKLSKPRTRARTNSMNHVDEDIKSLKELSLPTISEQLNYSESSWSNVMGKIIPGGKNDNEGASNKEYDPEVYETLPSGKVIKKQDLLDEDDIDIMMNLKGNRNSVNTNRLSGSDFITRKFSKKLRFKLNNEETDEEVMEIIRERMKDLE